MMVITAAQNKDGRRPNVSVTLPQHSPARTPPMKTAAVWSPVVAGVSWK